MSSLAQALIEYATSGGKSTSGIMRALSQRSPRYPAYSEQTRPAAIDHGEGGGEGAKSDPFQGGSQSGPTLVLPRTWKGTHPTSGGPWNKQGATAIDIMAKAGTIVGAPEPGTIVRHGSAQGGESLYFDRASDPDNLPDYWLGHITQALPVGTRIRRRGQRIARISPDHAAPHAHLDRIYR